MTAFMLLTRMQRTAAFSTILILLLAPLSTSKIDGRSVNESPCAFTDIHSRLNVATEIIESVRGKLQAEDLKQVCREISREAKPTNCSECKAFFRVAKPIDCSDIYQDGQHENGPYEIYPQSRILKGPLKVYCDMANGGGWTVIQRRGDFGNPQDYFFKSWNEYKSEFGDILKEFWLGNNQISALTNQRSYQLRIDLKDFEGNSSYAIYDEFWTEDETRNYTLHLSGYHGTAGDSFQFHNGMPFSTNDKDQTKPSCAAIYKAGWWYHLENCYQAHLNGPYLRGKQENWGGIIWFHFKGDKYSLKDTVMKIRPSDFGRNGTKPH